MTRIPVLLGLPPGERAGGGAHQLVDTARRAEAAGFAGVVLPEHMVMGMHTDQYPWGEFPGAPDAPWLEPLTMLSFIAAATTTLRLCTGILIAPLRPAVVLAKTAATLDVVAGGRLELGVGTGWQREEFEAEGVDFASRGRILTDTIAACRALWRDSPATFSSPTVSFADIWCEPKSPRPGGPVVLFSGTLTARNVRRIVELGDGWIPIMGEPPEGVAAGVRQLREAFTVAGRDPSELQTRASLPVARDSERRPDLARTLGGAPRLLEDGATSVVLPFGAFVRDESAIPAWFATVASPLAAVT